jgi:hypothetical protein
VGIRIGKGEKLTDIIGSMNAVAEGVLTSKSTYQLLKKMGLERECPILVGIYKVINSNQLGCSQLFLGHHFSKNLASTALSNRSCTRILMQCKSSARPWVGH